MILPYKSTAQGVVLSYKSIWTNNYAI
jgi:hypothetical protein